MIALRLLGFVWALPVSLIGAVVMLVFRPYRARARWLGAHGVRIVVEVFVLWLPQGYAAITFGHLQVYRYGQTMTAERAAQLRRHEDTHTLQGDVLGALNLPVYGVCSLVSWARGTGLYRGNALERWARAWESRP